MDEKDFKMLLVDERNLLLSLIKKNEDNEDRKSVIKLHIKQSYTNQKIIDSKFCTMTFQNIIEREEHVRTHLIFEGN